MAKHGEEVRQIRENSGSDDASPRRHETDSQLRQRQIVNTAKMDSFSVLPQDCFNAIVSFLSLSGCINLSHTSLTWMEEMNRSELMRRYRRLKTTTPAAYRMCCSPQQQGQSYYKLLNATEASPDDNVFLLPTVRDRIESLCHALPQNYANRQIALELLLAITNDADDATVATDDDDDDDVMERNPFSHLRHDNNDTDRNTRFRIALEIQNSLLRGHRLHAILLSGAIRSDPNHYGNGLVMQQQQQRQGGNQVLTVPLEQYIGDVLCAYFLMGHSAAGIVEGGPAELGWMEDLVREWNQTTSRRSAVHSYRAWIYLHSTLLRAASFTWKQQSRLGIASPLSSQQVSPSSLDVARGSLLRPHLPFVCGRGASNLARRMQLWDALRNVESLRTTLNDFGRLGPTFRGRDLIQSQTVFPSSCIEVAREFSTMSPNEYSNIASFSPFLRSWAMGEASVVAWLLFVHEEAGKSRPMTVVPPTVTVKCGSS